MNVELIQFIKSHQTSLNDFLDLIPVPIFIKDIEGRYINCNQAFETFVGLSRDVMLNKTVFELWDKELAEVYQQKDQELFDDPGLQVYESRVKNQDGSVAVVQFHKATFTQDNDGLAGLIGVIFDRTHERQLEDELRELAENDSLTGLTNRRAGMNLIKSLLNGEAAPNDIEFTLGIFDIDGFKLVNDHFGHDAGDKVLQSVKTIAATVLREYDLIFRYGGDEFIIFLPDTDASKAQIIANRLREAFEKYPFAIGGESLVLTISLGIASYPQHGQDLDRLINLSDQAMYKAKRAGRNRVEVADWISVRLIIGV